MSPEPLLVHRAAVGEPVIAIADLIEWLLVHDPEDLPDALVAGIHDLTVHERHRGIGGGIVVPAELDALGTHHPFVPESADDLRRGETSA